MLIISRIIILMMFYHIEFFRIKKKIISQFSTIFQRFRVYSSLELASTVDLIRLKKTNKQTNKSVSIAHYNRTTTLH